MDRRWKRTARNVALPWICLAGILVLFLFYLAHLHPANWFGRYSDDAVYFSSAKALAQGRGYIIPSLPGNPPQTKYPVLYPWLLSAVWKWSPSFPSNVALGICLTACFSCWFLVGAFELLRKLKGMGDWPALVIVALCAFEPHLVLFSGSTLSDLPFMALGITAALVADRALRSDGQLALAGLAGALAGLSMMMRSIGVAVVAGILVAGLFRRTFRQAAAFCAGATPFFASALWSARLSVAEGGSTLALPGWRQTLSYDTSYLKIWRICVPNLHVFWLMLRTNLEQAILAPAAYCLSPTLNIGPGRWVNSLGGLVGFFALAGLVRQARASEWKPIHFIFAFYLAVILLWSYPIMDRFLLLFLPFFIMGLWLEGKRLSGLVFATLRSAGPAGERLLAGIVAVGLVILAGIMAWNCTFGYRPMLRSLSTERKEISRQRLPLYAWIREHTAPQTVIVAAEDATLYMYTNRKAVVPIAFSTEWIYTGDHEVA